ncbi:hypothetical protein Sango_2844100 [Sesamum angolense]|uniref:Uncharacterized protein n=1 Tax=Sesamum angolense TaxID=2727404 RepID=A0AAE1T7R2_9LAMI|nr:hypothetical protein Sango_2844100 [Sesamum angolense]
MLVVPELENEVELLWTLRDTRKKLQLLRNERDHIEDEIHHLKWYLRFDGVNVVNKEELLAELAKLQVLRKFSSLAIVPQGMGTAAEDWLSKFSICTSGGKICLPLYQSSDEFEPLFP